MRTIVIADGLTKDYLGAEEPFAGSRRNVGRAEIERLLGRGKAHGRGPLPAFLRAVVESSKAGADLRLILLRGEEPVPEVLDPILKAAQEISAEGGGIPWRRLWEELSGDDATDPMPYDRDGACDRFVVVEPVRARSCPSGGSTAEDPAQSGRAPPQRSETRAACR